MALHVACGLYQAHLVHEAATPCFDLAYLDELNVTDKLEEWRGLSEKLEAPP